MATHLTRNQGPPMGTSHRTCYVPQEPRSGLNIERRKVYRKTFFSSGSPAVSPLSGTSAFQEHGFRQRQPLGQGVGGGHGGEHRGRSHRDGIGATVRVTRRRRTGPNAPDPARFAPNPRGSGADLAGPGGNLGRSGANPWRSGRNLARSEQTSRGLEETRAGRLQTWPGREQTWRGLEQTRRGLEPAGRQIRSQVEAPGPISGL